MKLSPNVINRLAAQRTEAENLGLQKTASGLATMLDGAEPRDNDPNFTFSFNQLQQNVEASLWKSAAQIADYYDLVADGEMLKPLIEAYAFELICDYNKLVNGPVIGIHEPAVPGETK
jgi:hypothetical protein